MLTDPERTVKCIREITKKYVQDNKLESLVVGVSGGIDSAVCACLVKPICNELNIPLIGLSLPIITNSDDEIRRANNIGGSFCDIFEEIDLSEPFEKELEWKAKRDLTLLENNFDAKNRIGNMKARERMKWLYDYAYKYKGMVLSTDNFTEYLLGYWTLHGDIGDFGMVQELWKTEVYQIAEYLKNDIDTCTTSNDRVNLWECYQAKATNGLGNTGGDLEEIGAESFEEVETILKGFIEDGDCTYQDHDVIKRYIRTHYKRMNPINIKREDII